MQRKIIINKRQFVRGKAECDCCSHRFKYLLPIDVIPFWENLCGMCSLAVPDVEPKPGQIVLEIMLPNDL